MITLTERAMAIAIIVIIKKILAYFNETSLKNSQASKYCSFAAKSPSAAELNLITGAVI